MRSTKACPVVTRHGALGDDILVFRHPAAGVQLVKGTIEVGETAAEAALRELAEESGIVSAELAGSIGVWNSGYGGEIWEFFEIRVLDPLPERWQHFAHDDGGHEFQFYWHPLREKPNAEWHPLFVDALQFIRAHRGGGVASAGSRGGPTGRDGR
jgi:8-oxo-dGTP pyrophosphatase MutT (NUDIX family)